MSQSIFLQCCDSGMFIPDPIFSISDPGSRFDKIPDPESASKNQVFLHQKTDAKFSIMRSPDPITGFFSIPDPETRSRGQKSTGSQSESATLFLQIFLKNSSKFKCNLSTRIRIQQLKFMRIRIRNPDTSTVLTCTHHVQVLKDGSGNNFVVEG